MTFEELKLAPAILKAVQEQGYDSPTPIQAQAIPAVLAGGDLLAGAQTGTGKTAAFTLPLLHRLSMGRSAVSKFGGTGVRALVLTPTRELAAQVEEQVRTYGKYLQLKSTVIFGGVGMNPQIDRLRRGVDIVVATPGRLLDLQQQGALDLSTVQVLVLDEADRMLDMGFIHDIRKVLALLPKQKQTLLFSATFSDEIRTLAGGLLNNPQSIQVTPSNTTVQRITQVSHLVGREQKKALLTHIIEKNNWSQVLVFTRTKFGANSVAEYLVKAGIPAMALHGNKSQSARTQALAGFKSGAIRALVATDIAARGIDIDELPHVVNYELPNISEDYVHRIGRTGRAGKTGEAVNLVCLDEEGFLRDIEKFIKQAIPREDIAGYGPAPGEKAEPLAMGRQTLWGGLGKPPSREVMAAAGKAARREMMDRVQQNKARQGGGGGRNGASASAPSGGAPRGNSNGGGRGNGNPNAPRAAAGRGGAGNGPSRGGNGGGARNGGHGRPSRSSSSY
ncbi:MAG: ATP-dependent RNA helicase RhlE [Paracidovorax wautersii]|uniref:ATP-dependent RNA helicase RhlE n=1 Tax=Paracidovorax wautersii TaxID=1177982 RepID=A0A7V8FQ74_9BURK|nr:MAG: ATP-dependent RNA helicase RhlE [Paracidovorax wautersii]